jgi:MFS family permease
MFRGLTGFFLAGIYPVGMKIAADYFGKNLGKSLGFLVGALVLGTAFPHLLKSSGASLPWKYVVYGTSALSALGGVIMLTFVPDGPFRKAGGQKIYLSAFAKGFRMKAFRSAAFGYFGHMWELYTFWAFVPVMLRANAAFYDRAGLNIPLLAFGIIASGALACVLGGYLSGHFGAKKIATISLCLSCLCCLLSPLFLFSASITVLVLFLGFWGLVVIADSPMFSTLIAQHVPAESKGSALTIVNCIGFSITIVSLEVVSALSHLIDPRYLYLTLAIGPILGITALVGNKDLPSTINP